MNYKDKTIVKTSYLFNEYPVLVQRHRYIEMAPLVLLGMKHKYIPNYDITKFRLTTNL